jgi:hypothetical protein
VELVWGVTALAATWGEASAASEAGTSGEGITPGAPGDGSATVGAGCTRVSDNESTPVAEDATGGVCAISAGGFVPDEARKKKYESVTAPNAATIAMPAISFRRLGSGARKASSSPNGARGGAQSSAGMLRLSSAK